MGGESAREELAYTLGVQACLWGRPLVEYHKTEVAALAVGGARVGGFRYFKDLKTAADWFIVTPNNVTIAPGQRRICPPPSAPEPGREHPV